MTKNKSKRNFIALIIGLSTLFILSLFSSAVYAKDLSDYQWIANDSFSKYNYSSIAYGSGKFVAVGHSGAIKTSEDGTSWVKRESNTQHWLRRIIWTGEKFIAVGYGYSPVTSNPVVVILTSEDGIKWVQQKTSDLGSDIRLGGIAWNGSKFVAVGEGGVCVSEDGINWDIQTTQQGLEDVVWGDGRFIAVGYDYPDMNSSQPVARLVSSEDGIEWDQIDVEIDSSLNRIIWTGDKYISVGKDGIIVVSRDGTKWTEVKSGVSFELSDVVHNGKDYVASGWDRAILSSADGESWEINDSTATNRVYTVAWGNGQYIGTGLKDFITNRETFVKSKNGTSWTDCNPDSDSNIFSGIGYDSKKGVFIIKEGQVNEETKSMQSYDGMNWKHSSGESAINLGTKTKAFNGSVYVRIGKYGTVQTSKDGVKWSNVDEKVICDINSVVWTGKMFIAVGYDGKIFTSIDGLQWTKRFSGEMFFRDVAYNGKVYIAVGDVGETAISIDGVNWRHVPNRNISGFERIIWTGERFIAVGRNGNVYSTVDGNKWNVFSTPTGVDLKDIVYEKGIYLVFGEGELLAGIPKNSTFLRFEGNAVNTDVLPIIENGRTLVPIRVISELLGGSVDWDRNNKLVAIEKGSIKIKLTIDSMNATVNSAKYQLDVPAKIINNRTMVPLRFVTDNLGLKVEWNAQNKTVDIHN